MSEYIKHVMKKISNLCDRISSCDLGIEEFYAEWPEKDESNKTLNEIYSDLETCIEHTPGYFFKKGVNIDKWRTSEDFRTVLCIKVMLPYFEKIADWTSFKYDVLSQNPKNAEEMQDIIKRKLGLQ